MRKQSKILSVPVAQKPVDWMEKEPEYDDDGANVEQVNALKAMVIELQANQKKPRKKKVE